MQVTAQTSASGIPRSAKGSQSVDLSASNFVSSKVQADATVKNAILKLLSGDSKFQSTFESSFFAEMQKAADMKLQITNENGMHNALVSVIMQNRSQFPVAPLRLRQSFPVVALSKPLFRARDKIPLPRHPSPVNRVQNFQLS